MVEPEWIFGPEILPKLAKLTGKPPRVSYRQMIEHAASARLPLERRGGRWGAPTSTLPLIAAALENLAA
jgi:hypothetical protein